MNNVTKMKQISEALKAEDICEAMSFLGFELIFYDESSPNDYFFKSRDDKEIVWYDADEQRFTVYVKTIVGEVECPK